MTRLYISMHESGFLEIFKYLINEGARFGVHTAEYFGIKIIESEKRI
jgi:hypothetical protein